MVPVASGDQAFQAEVVEVVAEVHEEVADLGTIAIAVDDLAFEVVFVVLEFIPDVGRLGVEFIIPAALSGLVQACVFGSGSV